MSAAQALLAPVLRVLIIPAWAGWDLGMILTYPLRTIAAPYALASAAVTGLSLVAGLLPYAFADAVLARIRRQRAVSNRDHG